MEIDFVDSMCIVSGLFCLLAATANFFNGDIATGAVLSTIGLGNIYLGMKEQL